MKFILLWVCRIFIGLLGVILLVQGFLWGFMPEKNLITYDINTTSILGTNMIKSDIGAGLLSIGIFSFLYLFRGKQWFLPLLIMILSYLIIRTLSFLLDGYHPTIILGIALETICFIAVLILNRLQSANNSK